MPHCSSKPDCLKYFTSDISDQTEPKVFTNPFHSNPHPLCVIAVEELKETLKTQAAKDCTKGKMFGVLVVKTSAHKIAYLAAVSGTSTVYEDKHGFVPPIYDASHPESHYKTEERHITQLNQQIKNLEEAPTLRTHQTTYQQEKEHMNQALTRFKEQLKKDKQTRAQQRENAAIRLSPPEISELEDALIKESLHGKRQLKYLTSYWRKRVLAAEQSLKIALQDIEALKDERKTRSAALQQHLFSQYNFLNSTGESKNVSLIFSDTSQKTPPAAAGDCAGPKLLQYAYLHQLKPIAMAEFWWGANSQTELRKEGHFYPACRGKCEPILKHMLKGINLEEIPTLTKPDLQISLVYEDDLLVVINKPSGLLSVPGKGNADSVYRLMAEKYPLASGPLLVHRLDMDTSGLMILAKNQDTHKFLQNQFIKRTIKKRYIALLDGIIANDQGVIDLPLRVDLDDRPRQMVCYQHGKKALTKWNVIARENQQTRIYFYPETGRTHQLRIHAAHELGLNTPIVGDRLYGTSNNRLLLHAEYLEFIHPNGETMTISCAAEF